MSQLDITNESRRSAEGQPTTRHQQTDVHESITKQDRNNINDPHKKHRLGTVSKNIILEGLIRFKVKRLVENTSYFFKPDFKLCFMATA